MQQSLTRSVQQGYIAEQPLGPLAHLWFGIFAEGACSIVHAADQPTAKAAVKHTIANLS